MTILEFVDKNGAGLAIFVLILAIWGIPAIIRAFRGEESDF